MVCGVNGWQSSGQSGKFRPRIDFTICTNQFHLPKKRPRRSETGIKDGFEGMEHEFPFGIFHPEKQDYLFRFSVAPGHFPLGRSKKSCFIYFPTGFPGKFTYDRKSF